MAERKSFKIVVNGPTDTGKTRFIDCLFGRPHNNVTFKTVDTEITQFRIKKDKCEIVKLDIIDEAENTISYHADLCLSFHSYTSYETATDREFYINKFLTVNPTKPVIKVFNFNGLNQSGNFFDYTLVLGNNLSVDGLFIKICKTLGITGEVYRNTYDGNCKVRRYITIPEEPKPKESKNMIITVLGELTPNEQQLVEMAKKLNIKVAFIETSQ